MKILVMGAGAIGAFYGAWLQRAGDEVYFCARGEHLRALKEHGLEVKSVNGDFHIAVKASSDPREFAPYELILFCVKSQDTLSTARQLVGCLADGGAVLTIQNGVENEALLCEVFPREQVMGGNARVGAEITAPGKLLHTVGGNAEIGELDGRKTARAERIAESFRRAGVLGELTDDLLTIRWHKLMGNNGTNTVCTLGRCSVGAAISDPEGAALVRQLFLDVVRVGRAEGAKLERRAGRETTAPDEQLSRTSIRSAPRRCRIMRKASGWSTTRLPGRFCARPESTASRCPRRKPYTRC